MESVDNSCPNVFHYHGNPPHALSWPLRQQGSVQHAWLRRVTAVGQLCKDVRKFFNTALIFNTAEGQNGFKTAKVLRRCKLILGESPKCHIKAKLQPYYI